MCIFNFKKKFREQAQQVNTPVIVRSLIEKRIDEYNNAIDTYTNLYLQKFYEEWKKSINKLEVHSVDQAKTIFIVEDNLVYRPLESWSNFIEEVLVRHPDMTYTEEKINNYKDSPTKYIFNYKNCLDDPIDF